MLLKNDQELAKELVDFNGDRYKIVVLASKWAKELKKTDKYKNQPASVVIKKALNDILSGDVTEEDVLRVCSENLAKELKAEEEARLEAERKAKEPMKL